MLKIVYPWIVVQEILTSLTLAKCLSKPVEAGTECSGHLQLEYYFI